MTVTSAVLWIYDRARRYPAIALAAFAAITAAAILLMSSLDYEEDISAFLPVDGDSRTALSAYQQISGADRIYAIISADSGGPERLAAGADMLADNIAATDSLGLAGSVVTQVDTDMIGRIAAETFENIPFLLTDADYARIDSLLARPGCVPEGLADARRELLLPSSSMIADNISRDPLGLFTPAIRRLSSDAARPAFDTYDGHILSPDATRAIVIITSGAGARESDRNARLVGMLRLAADRTEAADPGLEIHITGGPVIAVGNADRIKSDSLVAVCIAAVLIIALLVYVFRNAVNILLVPLSVGWGWIFAMGVTALVRDSVSVIVAGIASVIIGIAVNYPLHMIDHVSASRDRRSALREIISPLVVGNITTVGAFLCLIPLDSPALHDLGLFSSLLLAGTLLFVLLCLPHLVRMCPEGKLRHDPTVITRLASITPTRHRGVVAAVVILTLIFGLFSLRTEFDTDMRSINYMTPAQKADIDYFSSITTPDSTAETLYVVSSGESLGEALSLNGRVSATVDSLVAEGKVSRVRQASALMLSPEQLTHRLERWREFTARHASRLEASLAEGAAEAGFRPGAFDPFISILSRDYTPGDYYSFLLPASQLMPGYISTDSLTGLHSVAEVLSVDRSGVDAVRARIGSGASERTVCFDVGSMNRSIAGSLSADFNYIGIACGLIVFLFLWASLGRFELAVISFMPMAISWVWILGIMGLLGLHFNIVNIILATFIFGQGDDYTIFITEGLTYEFAYRRRLLTSYKSSIIVSALIMFAGIGTLTFARHPALRSLGEVTVVGMLSVVLMAWVIPPLMFSFIVSRDGRLRPRPLTIASLFRHRPCRPDIAGAVMARYLYKGALIERRARRTIKALERQRALLECPAPADGRITVADLAGMGETALMLAMLHPDAQILLYLPGTEARDIVRGCLHDTTLSVTLLTDRPANDSVTYIVTTQPAPDQTGAVTIRI